MIRVLHIVGTLNYGGIEVFLMNVYRKINREKIQFDFAVYSKEKGVFEDEIINLGGKIYHLTPKSQNILKSFLELRKVIKGNYKIVHRHTASATSFFDLMFSKISGAKTIISHSHNCLPSNLDSFKEKFLKKLINIFPTDRFACSKEAGIYLFGKRQVMNKKVTIVNNGIDVKKFRYNIEKRNELRNKLDINNKFVVGHIGRFEEQKNHSFLIDIFNEVKKIEENSVMLLVGSGEKEDEIKRKVNELNLQQSVRFLGKSSEIYNLIQAMDVFVLPSHYEGLPVVLVEAQCSGIKSFTSEGVVSKEAKITDDIEYISLKKPPNEWAKSIIKYKKYNRIDNSHEVVRKGFDIESTVKFLESFYIKNS